jgi:hypothetical protein
MSENRLVELSVVLEVASKEASRERVAAIVIEIGEIKAEKFALETQTEEQRVAARALKKEECKHYNAEREFRERSAMQLPKLPTQFFMAPSASQFVSIVWTPHANIIRSNQWLIQIDNSTSIVRRLQYSSLLLMLRCGSTDASSAFYHLKPRLPSLAMRSSVSFLVPSFSTCFRECLMLAQN